jgi:ferric-dicitrate binding protein FerR (iron transport regulator)
MKMDRLQRLLMYFKRKDKLPLTEEEQRIEVQYEKQLPELDISEEDMIDYAGMHKEQPDWDKFKEAFAQPKKAVSWRWKDTFAVAASLMLAIGITWFFRVELAHSTAANVEWVTLRIPRGKQHSLTLPDSSVVRLNAATVFHYPVTFEGSERRVVVEEGEAGFEIMKAAQPFIVRSKGMEIQALGTKFNVNAYGDKAIVIATLVEGSIRVTYKERSLLLMPGGEVALSRQGQLQHGHATLGNVTAWNKGYFGFENASLPEIMAEIQRWYDVEVVYKDSLTDQRITIIKWPRSESLYTLLSTIEEVSRMVHIELKDKKVFVSKCRGRACQSTHR